MPTEPAIKRTIAIFDGQNLFHAVKVAFGYTYPNFDALKLSQTICQEQGWNLIKVCFYTGVPDLQDNPKGHYFWRNKLAAMGRHSTIGYNAPKTYVATQWLRL